MNASLLFVYGLLRRNASHEMSHFLSSHTAYVSEASFQGKMYLIDYYPGIVPSDNPGEQVKGDVLQLPSLDVLRELDYFEGVGPPHPVPNEYLRTVRPVLLAEGKTEDAWMYLYNWPTDSAPQIHSGDFLEYMNLIR